MSASFLEVFGDLSGLTLSLANVVLLGLALDLGRFLLLLIHLFLVAVFDFLLLLVEVLVSGAGVFGLSSLDLLKSHADDGLSYSSCFSSSFLLDFIDFNLLVKSSPCLGPGKLNWLDFLVIK